MTFTPRRRSLAAVLSVAAAGLGLAACGGSSSSSTTNAAAAAAAGGGGRFAAVRTCLAQNGITLPARPAGAGRPPGAGAGAGPGAGGGFGLGLGAGRAGGAAGPGGGLARRLPAGVTAAQFQAALKKCGAGALGVGPGFGARRLQTPAAKAALAKFVTCMQGKGVKLPAANTTGTGPVFNTKGIKTTSASFKAAYAACQPLLASVFPRRAAAGVGGAPGGGATTTAPSAP